MWSPTHCSVTVQRARGLLTKGKHDTNNCFVTISLGKEKYQTSVKEKADTSVNWNEECELKIPDQGNKAELTLTCLHRNTLGIDEFLGQATLPLKDMDVYDRPRAKWLKLESKPGKEKKHKERGELEVRIAFVVKSGSLTDLSKKDKHKSSIGLLASSVGGSLLSIGQGEKRKSIKKLAGSLSSKLHIRSKKKNVDGDDSGSFSGSFTSIGTPTSSSGLGGIGGGSERRHGQRAGEADPGVISEDEDEFVFDNLSHKSSGSSLNVHRSSLQVPPTIKTTNFAPRNPSPLLSNGNTAVKGKQNGGKPKFQKTFDKDPIVAEMEQLELDFSVRTRTLPPPSKPPRTQPIQREIEVEGETEKPIQNIELNTVLERPFKLDEWESKLYGGENYLDIGSTDSLKRRSFESRVRLPISNTEPFLAPSSSVLSSSLQFDSDGIEEQPPKSLTPPLPLVSFEKSNTSGNSLLSSNVEPLYIDSSHASPVMFEQRNSTALFIDDALQQRTPQLRVTDKEQLTMETDILVPGDCDDAYNFPDKDSKLETRLCVNEHKIQEDAETSPEIQIEYKGQRSSDANRQEDQKLLSFVDFSVCMDKDTVNNDTHTNSNFLTLQQSPKEFSSIVGRDGGHGERCEKRFGKFKYGNKRDKQIDTDSNSASPKSAERIIVGHEKSSQAERRSEISAQLSQKYNGKSREELMLIANGMENEALLQRQRVKELEDYLDNLLLRVMETHPKILQNPYSRTTSAKSYKNYINMNDFLKTISKTKKENP